MGSILLTGGFGFIGIHLLKKIHDSKIIVFSRDFKDKNELLVKPGKIIHETGDIKNYSRLEQVIKKYQPSVIIHLAALTGIKKCHDNPEETFLTNVYGTYNVVSLCTKYNSRFVFLSSREVYGNTNGYEVSENDQTHPNNIYGLTKLIAENIIRWANKKDGLKYTIIRPTNLYGPGGDNYGAQVLIKKVISGEKIQIFGGEQKMNFIFVSDVVEVISKILADKKTLDETFNVGSENTLTINDFVNLIFSLSNKKSDIEYLPMRETETVDFGISIEKIKKFFDWKPMTIQDGLIHTINWYTEKTEKV